MMMKKKNLQILLICGVLLVTACKSKSKEEQQSGYRMEGDTVKKPFMYKGGVFYLKR